MVDELVLEKLNSTFPQKTSVFSLFYKHNLFEHLIIYQVSDLAVLVSSETLLVG